MGEGSGTRINKAIELCASGCPFSGEEINSPVDANGLDSLLLTFLHVFAHMGLYTCFVTHRHTALNE